MPDETNRPTPLITDDMIAAAAHAYAKNDGYDWTEISVPWRDRYHTMASAALAAALDGHAVVELREPDRTSYGNPEWSGYGVEVSGGQIWDGTRHLRPRAARVYAAELLSAADHADLKAAEVTEVSHA